MEQNQNISDTFGRVHDYLRISLTDKCNLRCYYCMPVDGITLKDREAYMTSNEVVAIAKEFVSMGVKKIRLTGGEPLVKKGVSDIIQALGQLPIELTLTTNAVLVDKFIEDFKNAGITSINVSLDSLEPDRFNAISRRKYFEKITQNIELLLKEQFKVKINVVLIKGENDHEIIDFIRWTAHTPVHIRFIEFMPFDGNSWTSEKTVSFQDILTRAETAFGPEGFARIPGQKNDTSRNFQLKNGKGTFGIISTVTHPFCDSCNRIRLTADGKIKNCLFSEEESDLLRAHRSGVSIAPIVSKALGQKHQSRGGLKAFTNETIRSHSNRSMISIGG